MNTWLPKIYTVGQVEKLNEDTASFTLLPDDGSEVVFEPGQFNMIYVFGIGEIPISISGGNEDNFHHTVRDIGLISKALANLKPGMKVGMRGPYGSAWPLKACEGSDVIVAAGGIGLAPLRPVLDPVRHSWPMRLLRNSVAREVTYPPLPADLAAAISDFYQEDMEALRRFAPHTGQRSSCNWPSEKTNHS